MGRAHRDRLQAVKPDSGLQAALPTSGLKYLSNPAKAGAMLRRQHVLFSSLAVAILATIAMSAQTQPRAQQPSRDTSAQQPATVTTPPAKGRIAGRVLTADTGRPVARARVFINAAEVPGGRGTTTDADGTYEFTELPAGRYSVNVSKTGFISLVVRPAPAASGRNAAAARRQPAARRHRLPSSAWERHCRPRDGRIRRSDAGHQRAGDAVPVCAGQSSARAGRHCAN